MREAPRGWLVVFCGLVLIWEPVSLALLASSKIAVIADRPSALAILAARLVSSGLGIAAGLALWHQRPAGLPLAKAYLILSSLVVLIVLTTPYFPTNLVPGSAPPLAIAILVQNAAWFAYLTRASRS